MGRREGGGYAPTAFFGVLVFWFWVRGMKTKWQYGLMRIQDQDQADGWMDGWMDWTGFEEEFI